jgi:hypothetical protein
MLRRTFFLTAAGFALSCVWLRADQAATVTEAVNIVDHGTKDAVTTRAEKGTNVYNGEYLKTGVESRAELQLPSTSITRLGANTIFNYSTDTNTIDLQAGTVLFCKPKNAAQLNIRTAAVTAAVLGTTGFIGVQGEGKKKVFRLGVIEGHVRAQVNGLVFRLGAGDILQFGADGHPFVFAYDVPKFVGSSPLLNKFHGTLPNQQFIQAEVQSYENDVKRGFIGTPLQQPQYWGQLPIAVPPNQYDSPHQAQPGARPQPPPPRTRPG